jgi:hypothetical protein
MADPKRRAPTSVSERFLLTAVMMLTSLEAEIAEPQALTAAPAQWFYTGSFDDAGDGGPSSEGANIQNVIPRYVPMHPALVREPFHRAGHGSLMSREPLFCRVHAPREYSGGMMRQP